MSRFFDRLTCWLMTPFLLSLLLGAPALGQVTGPPFVFVSGTVINPDEVNLNYSTIYAAALNRAGGTMTGNLLFSADNTLDIGASGATRPRDLFLGRNAAIGGTLGVTGATTLSSTLGVSGATTLAALTATTGSFSSTLGVSGASTLAALSATTGSFSSTLAVTGAATLTSTLAVNSTSAAAIDVAGGITAGSGNVAVIDTTGKIPAISSTYFASLSGANLTSIPETAITDDSIFARVASPESISGTWTINNNVALQSRNAATAVFNLASTNSSNQTIFGPTGADIAGGIGTTTFLHGTTLTFSTGTSSLASRTAIDASGTLTHSYGLVLSNTISPSALSTGNNNNYNPTGLSSAYLIRLDGGAGSPVLTGLSGGVAGRVVVLCRVAGTGISITDEDANSTAANRFLVNGGATLLAGADGNCLQFIYDSTSARWRNISVTQ